MKKIAYASLLALVSCVSDVNEDESTGTISQASHAWGNYRWIATDGVATVVLSRNLTSNWSPFLDVASTDWSLSTVVDTFVTQGSVNPRTCKPTLGRVEVCNAKYGRNGWLGIASVWADSTGRISQATVKLNDTYFSMPQYDTPDWRTLVMCQEIAHTLGLDHQDEDFANVNLGTCMDYTSNPVGPPANTHPNAHDYEELEIVYGSITTTTIPNEVRPIVVHVFPTEIE